MPNDVPRRYTRRRPPEGKLNLTDAAERLGVSRERVRQLVAKGRLGPVERLNPRRVYLLESCVDAEVQRRAAARGLTRIGSAA